MEGRAGTERALETGFLLVSKGKRADDPAHRVVAIQSHLAGLAEFDDQFAKSFHIGERPPDLGGRFQEGDMTSYGLGRTLRSLRILRGQKPTTPLKTDRRLLGDDYSWHSGNSVSASAPQLLRQERTSCPVRCSPVS